MLCCSTLGHQSPLEKRSCFQWVLIWLNKSDGDDLLSRESLLLLGSVQTREKLILTKANLVVLAVGKELDSLVNSAQENGATSYSFEA